MLIINSQYVYLVSTFIGLIPVIIFFILNKKYRFDILCAGLIMAFNSLFTAYLFWTKDWWFPETFFGNRVGFEDFILGFNTGALAIIINNLFFPIEKLESKNKNWKIVISTVLVFFFSMTTCFYLFEIHSFISFIISSILSMTWIYIQTYISPIKSIIFAVFYALFSLPMYFIIFFINKNWILNTWDLNLLSGILIFNFIPIEEFVFWLLFGVIFKQIYIAWLNISKK